jgi:hypothetical protein
MAVYMITYDLRARDKRAYTGLYDAIKSYEYWCRPFESVWFIDLVGSNETEISKKLKDHVNIESSDTLLVVRITRERAGFYSAKCVDWMQSELRTWKTPSFR